MAAVVASVIEEEKGSAICQSSMMYDVRYLQFHGPDNIRYPIADFAGPTRG